MLQAEPSGRSRRNGGSNCGVFWQVGGSATLGTGTTLLGSIVTALLLLMGLTALRRRAV
ncbi:MAG TPA: ice-binding family protein [Thermoanaerobaculia bacterium]|nr:ice-binding family protein [Thermoanaerobaculia bacterium]